MRTDIYEAVNVTAEIYDNALEQMAKDIPLRKVGESEEIAKHIAFLASDDSSFITATHLLDDGGAIWSGK